MSSLFRVIGALAVMVVSVSAFAATALDGTTWRVEVTESGSNIPQYFDQVSFKEEKLNTAIFQRKGYVPSPYTYVEKPDGPKVWEVTQKNDAEGDLEWHGEIQGEALTGTLLWKKKDGTVVTYALVGAPAVEEPTAEEAEVAEAKKAKASKGKMGCGCTLIR